MSEKQGIVTNIMVAEDRTYIRMTENEREIALRTSHAAYSSIYTLLMASAANKRVITLDVNDASPVEIQWARYDFQ